MPLPLPRLDDRTFPQLLEQATGRIRREVTAWTADQPSDPGVVLLELYAHLTETMLFRLNRLPEKAYIEFLRFLGVTLIPPSAAITTLTFRRAVAAPTPLLIPAGTRVAAARGEPGSELPVFATLADATIPPDATEVAVAAAHAVPVSEEPGLGSGAAGQSFDLRKTPLVAPLPGGVDLAVGVEIDAGAAARAGTAVRWHEQVPYGLWREVGDFTEGGTTAQAFIADRQAGRIWFPGAARLVQGGRQDDTATAAGAFPADKRRIRVWYRSGGGPAGNLPAGTLTVLKDTIPGVTTVLQPAAATGGRPGETLAEALERGPQEFYAHRRAVTALDYELLAVRALGTQSRAKAYTRAALYPYGTPGTVDVLVVPAAEPGAARPTREALLRLQTPEQLARVRGAIDDGRPLGTECAVDWVRYKPVAVEAAVVARGYEDPQRIAAAIAAAIDQRLHPLRQDGRAGWEFGAPLRTSHLYDAILSVPGVAWAERLALTVEDAPDHAVAALAADPSMAGCWYAGSAGRIFVSVNDGDGWELALDNPGEQVVRLLPHPQVPGLVAAICEAVPQAAAPAPAAAAAGAATPAATAAGAAPTPTDAPADAGRSGRVLLSRDCGQTWREAARTAQAINDGAWAVRDNAPVLFLATDGGLFSLTPDGGAGLEPALVDPQFPAQRLYAVTTATHGGLLAVAVAAESQRGVFLSYQGGRGGTFAYIGQRGNDVRVLAIQGLGSRYHLYAGLAAVGNAQGTNRGCLRSELPLAAGGDAPAAPTWVWANVGWSGGSCRDLVIASDRVFAATYNGGVLAFDPTANVWKPCTLDCGLPLRSDAAQGVLQSVDALAIDPRGAKLLAGGGAGVFRAAATTVLRFTPAAQRTYADKVPLPPTWLFCVGEHRITVTTPP